MLRRLPLPTLLLAAALMALQADLWFGKGNLPTVLQLRQQLAAQLQHNEGLRERNARVAAEAADLREGLEIAEEKARADLGMLRPNEILVQVTARR